MLVLASVTSTSLHAMEAEFAENQQSQTEQTHPAYSEDLWNNMMQALPVDVVMNVVMQQSNPREAHCNGQGFAIESEGHFFFRE